MKKIDCIQGKEQWHRERMCRPTASEFKYLVTPKWEIRKWTTEMPNTYLAAKLAERWKGEPNEGFYSAAMEQGSLREKQAIPWYEGIYDAEIERVGFVASDDGRIGCSPDGMFPDGSPLELKVPEPKNHTKYLLAGVVPEEYTVQVQGEILVCEKDHGTFMSWRPDFPKLVVQVSQIDEAKKALREALAAFLAKFDEGWRRLVEMNGGELPPPPPTIERGEDGSVTKTMAGRESEVTQWLRNGERR